MENEKRLIDANALMKYINEEHSYAGLPMASHILTMELLTYAPTVDAVEVVRCKDCVHNLGDDDRLPRCTYWHEDVKPNFFCGHGERKDNA